MTTPNPDNQDFVRGWRADEPLLNPPFTPQESESEGSTARFEKQLGGRWSTEGIVRSMVVSAIWKRDDVLRNEAIETAKDRYPMPANTPRWLAKEYEKAWRKTGRELIRSTVFGLEMTAAGLTSEQHQAREDQRRKELLAYHFMVPYADRNAWGTEKQQIESDEAEVNRLLSILERATAKSPTEEKLIAEQYQELVERRTAIAERRIALGSRQNTRVQEVLAREASETTSAQLLESLKTRVTDLLETLGNPTVTAGMTAADIQNLKMSADRILGTAPEWQSKSVSLAAFEKIWSELDKGALQDYRDRLQNKLIDKLTGTDFWEIARGNHIELSQQLRERFVGKRGSSTVNPTTNQWEGGELDNSQTLAAMIRKQKAELDSLYAEQDKQIIDAQNQFEAAQKAKAEAEKKREEARKTKKKAA